MDGYYVRTGACIIPLLRRKPMKPGDPNRNVQKRRAIGQTPGGTRNEPPKGDVAALMLQHCQSSAAAMLQHCSNIELHKNRLFVSRLNRKAAQEIARNKALILYLCTKNR